MTIITEPQTPAQTVPTQADLLELAADLIDQTGWWDGGSFDSEHRGSCAVEAITQAVMESFPGAPNRYERADDVIFGLARSLGLSSSEDVPEWNDSRSSGRVVTDALRSAAIAARSGLI